MGAAYIVCGFLLGVFASHVSFDQPQWSTLIAPAAICIIAGWCFEEGRR